MIDVFRSESGMESFDAETETKHTRAKNLQCVRNKCPLFFQVLHESITEFQSSSGKDGGRILLVP